MASMLSLLHLLRMAVPGGCPALGLAVTGSTGWERVVSFVHGVEGLSGLWQYQKAFAIWLFTWEPYAPSSCDKHQEIHALDKKVS